MSEFLKQKILETLKENKQWLSTTKISVLCRRSFYEVEPILETLYKEGIIKMKKENSATYWLLEDDFYVKQ